MLLIEEKGNRGGICHSIYRYAKANNKYMKIKIKTKIKNHYIFNVGMQKFFMLGQCCKSFQRIILSVLKILLNLTKFS